MGGVGHGRYYARLGIECLEGRICPSKGLLITDFEAFALPKHVAHLKGKVIDEDPASVQLTFTGAVQGTTSPDAAGNFKFTTKNAVLGMVYVEGINSRGLTAQREDPLAVPHPVVTFSIHYGEQKNVTLRGKVKDLDPAGRVVTFSGQVHGSVITDARGFFNFTTTALGLGEVSGSTVNLWELQSAIATETIYSAPPQIVELTAGKSPDGVWSICGKVVDESPAGLVVYFSNVPELEGASATVGSDGYFCLTVSMKLSQPVQLHADVNDWWGLAADTAWVNLDP